ncbi:MAG TPA: Crp/Fnr family transcriptional regulator [Vineibacter sp.]|nr:Crp/Fnr family transcriptional regulator [Vineibacter sp.]
MKPVYEPCLDLIDIFEARVRSALPQAQTLRGRIVRTRVAQGQALFHAGARETRLFLVKAGVIKFAYMSEDGVERVRDFIAEGQIAACVGALAGNPVAAYSGIACQDAIVESLDFAPICQLTKSEPLWARCVGLLLYDVTRNLDERERTLLTLTPSDRLAQAIAERPWLLTRVSQRDLAAYIGITPVSLSRLKARTRRQVEAAAWFYSA